MEAKRQRQRRGFGLEQVCKTNYEEDAKALTKRSETSALCKMFASLYISNYARVLLQSF